MRNVIRLDDYDVNEFADFASRFGRDSFAYVVTPNADHFIRLCEDDEFRKLYADASYVLLDSRFLSNIIRVVKGVRTKVCTGSDLTARMFDKVIAPDDTVVLIGSSTQQADQLRERYKLRDLRHLNPPMGFIRDPIAVEDCLKFVESNSPYRYCLIAVGTPQGEMLAQMLKNRSKAVGLTFCIGASINFITGVETRAPKWMRSCGVEWLYRLTKSPRRLANRYLVRGPRIFRLLPSIDLKINRAPSSKSN